MLVIAALKRANCAVGVGSVAYLMKSDVRRGSGMLKQNLKTIRGWLEEEGTKTSKYVLRVL